MSHVSLLAIEVNNLDALEEACQLLGLKLERGRKEWRWYGRWVNDYHAPQAAYHHGVSPNEYGQCAEHVITIPGDNRAYEIGVVRRRDGVDGWWLLYDNYAGGYGMSAKVGGAEAAELQQAYTVCLGKQKYTAMGFNCTVVKRENKNYQCVATRKKVVRNRS